jgi:hypothetical protein
VRDLRPARRIEIASAELIAEVWQDGFYRFEVEDSGTRVITRRGGRAEVTIGADRRSLEPDMLLAVDPAGSVKVTAAPPWQEWDRWNVERTDQILASTRSPVGRDEIVGLGELDAYGEWRTVPTYGWVWVPRVPRSWVPYSTGRWVWDPFYGWTWVDFAPWGWAPFHYGRWVLVSSVWAWAPGPIIVRPVYAPALVAFFSGSGFRVGIGFGVPAVTWVPLSWGEPCFPWWGPAWFIGKPWWGGWHGPKRPGPWWTGEWHRARNDQITELVRPDAFEHARSPRAIVAVARERFGRAPVAAARVEQVRVERPFVGHDLARRRPGSFDPSVSEPSVSESRDATAHEAARLPRPVRRPDGRFSPPGSPRASDVHTPPQRELHTGESPPPRLGTRANTRPGHSASPADRIARGTVDAPGERRGASEEAAPRRPKSPEPWGRFAPRFRSPSPERAVPESGYLPPTREQQPPLDGTGERARDPVYDRNWGKTARQNVADEAFGGDSPFGISPPSPARPPRRPEVPSLSWGEPPRIARVPGAGAPDLGERRPRYGVQAPGFVSRGEGGTADTLPRARPFDGLRSRGADDGGSGNTGRARQVMQSHGAPRRPARR